MCRTMLASTIRDVPCGIISSLLTSAAAYVMMAAAISGMVPYAAIDPAAPFSRAFQVG